MLIKSFGGLFSLASPNQQRETMNLLATAIRGLKPTCLALLDLNDK